MDSEESANQQHSSTTTLISKITMSHYAVAFDLDGTLIDNNHYHLLAWQAFYEKRNRKLSLEEYKTSFNGRTNADVVKYVFNDPNIQQTLIDQYTREKEELYREIYAPHIQPVKGLIPLLEALQQRNIPMVIATSGILPNIDFMFTHIPIRHFFSNVIYSAHISKGKPDPEIYQLAANKMGLPPENCIAFEDATVGIRSAKAAGMKVVALTTTHAITELGEADRIITDFSEISPENLGALVP